MTTLRQAAGLIAAVLVAAFGFALMSASTFLGGGLVVVGAIIGVWHLRNLAQARRNPYDLSRLWEREPEPPDEADETQVEDEGTLYCHGCGHAVPHQFHRCPDCNRPLT